MSDHFSQAFFCFQYSFHTKFNKRSCLFYKWMSKKGKVKNANNLKSICMLTKEKMP